MNTGLRLRYVVAHLDKATGRRVLCGKHCGFNLARIAEFAPHNPKWPPVRALVFQAVWQLEPWAWTEPRPPVDVPLKYGAEGIWRRIRRVQRCERHPAVAPNRVATQRRRLPNAPARAQPLKKNGVLPNSLPAIAKCRCSAHNLLDPEALRVVPNLIDLVAATGDWPPDIGGADDLKMTRMAVPFPELDQRD